ncbi:cation transporter, partial [Pseudomonas sp. BAY1663]|uniref:cation transporter n=1 Tax=Pseudomonas sp. BAY1663 TaxID=1439940 RepID=UPI000561FDA4
MNQCCGHDHPNPQRRHEEGQASAASRSRRGSGERTRLRIEQMDCPTEERLIRERLDGMPGIGALEFNLIDRVLTVEHAADALPAALAAIGELGFSAEPQGAAVA